MIFFSLIVWASLVLFFPDSMITYYGDIPLLAMLLSQRKISWARYAVFLSLIHFDPRTAWGVSALIRLLSVDTCHFLLKNIYISSFIRASLASMLLAVLDWVFSCFLLPSILSHLFYEIPVWNTKLFLFSVSIACGLTMTIFFLAQIARRYKTMKGEEQT